MMTCISTMESHMSVRFVKSHPLNSSCHSLMNGCTWCSRIMSKILFISGKECTRDLMKARNTMLSPMVHGCRLDLKLLHHLNNPIIFQLMYTEYLDRTAPIHC